MLISVYKLKRIVHGPEETPLGELAVDENRYVYEKEPAPKLTAAKIPTVQEARRMSAGELEAILSK